MAFRAIAYEQDRSVRQGGDQFVEVRDPLGHDSFPPAVHTVPVGRGLDLLPLGVEHRAENLVGARRERIGQ